MSVEEFLSEWHSPAPTLLVHTSGSTGQPKPLWVEKRRMEASARITCEFLGLHAGDTALLCMPLDYIAGKMMVVRALTCGLQLISVAPSGHPLANQSACDFAAMVPLQVYNSLQIAEERERLMQIRHLIIGGGTIEEQLRHFPNAVWSTYGMTETLSHIALRRLSGPEASQWYTPFPTVALSLSEDGCLIIDAPQVCNERLTTNDLAEIAPDGRFRILGRKDNVICSGGIKIQIEDVEQLLKPHIHSPFLITKRKDVKLGEAVVLLTEGDINEAKEACQQLLPRHWQPRHYQQVTHIPLTETGKPARQIAEKIAEKG
jgi:O-succinylbenzoic acid--CoA ligase